MVCLVCPLLWAWFGLALLQSVSWVCVASLRTVGIVCPTACGVRVDSEVGGGSFLVIACVGGEGGTVYSSIWLLIEEAGMDSLVLL